MSPRRRPEHLASRNRCKAMKVIWPWCTRRQKDCRQQHATVRSICAFPQSAKRGRRGSRLLNKTHHRTIGKRYLTPSKATTVLGDRVSRTRRLRHIQPGVNELRAARATERGISPHIQHLVSTLQHFPNVAQKRCRSKAAGHHEGIHIKKPAAHATVRTDRYGLIFGYRHCACKASCAPCGAAGNNSRSPP